MVIEFITMYCYCYCKGIINNLNTLNEKELAHINQQAGSLEQTRILYIQLLN